MRIEEILEDCLAAVVAGRATPQECLARYPQLRQELEPLLAMAAGLRSIPHPILAESRRLAIRERLMSLPRQQRQPVAMPRLILRPAIVLATLLFAFLLGGAGLALASEGSVPGDNLYPVKRTLESIALATVPTGEPEADLRLFIAERRLNEAVALLGKGQTEPADGLLGEYRQQLEAVEWLIASEIARTGQAPNVASRLQEQLGRQEGHLSRIRGRIPQKNHPPIDKALITIQEFLGITDRVLEGTPPPFPPAGGHNSN